MVKSCWENDRCSVWRANVDDGYMFAWRSTRSESQRGSGGRKLEEARAARGEVKAAWSPRAGVQAGAQRTGQDGEGRSGPGRSGDCPAY